MRKGKEIKGEKERKMREEKTKDGRKENMKYIEEKIENEKKGKGGKRGEKKCRGMSWNEKQRIKRNKGKE